MSCLLDQVKTTSCDAKAQIGGLRPNLWLFNLESNGVKLSYTESGNTISAITVQSGEQAFRVDAEKYAHNFSIDEVKPDSQNVFYQQLLNVRTLVVNDADLTWLDSMLKATNLVAIVERPNQTFVLLGQRNGLTSIAGTVFDTGQTADSDQNNTSALQGEETDAPYKFVDVGTGYEDTLNYIVSLETPAP